MFLFICIFFLFLFIYIYKYINKNADLTGGHGGEAKLWTLFKYICPMKAHVPMTLAMSRV